MPFDSDAPGAPRVDPDKATKERLLEAAVKLFAERGFRGASVRAVTEAAGTSVSAANYHFGSKEELLREAITSRAAPLNARRMQALAAVEQAAGEGAPSVEAVVAAFVNPVLEIRGETNADEPAYRALAARLYVDPPRQIAEIRREIFEPVNERFREVLSRVFPEAAPEQVALALQLALGVLVHMLSGNVPSSDASGVSLSRLFRQLVLFAAAGIKAVCREAPSSAPSSNASGGEAS